MKIKTFGFTKQSPCFPINYFPVAVILVSLRGRAVIFESLRGRAVILESLRGRAVILESLRGRSVILESLRGRANNLTTFFLFISHCNLWSLFIFLKRVAV